MRLLFRRLWRLQQKHFCIRNRSNFPPWISHHPHQQSQVMLLLCIPAGVISIFRNIPDMENWYSKLYDKKDVTDPFVDVKLGKARIAKTAVIDNSLNPVWNEAFKIEVCHKADSLIFDVRDKDHAYTEVVGIVDISAQHLVNGQIIEGWFPIRKSNKV